MLAASPGEDRVGDRTEDHEATELQQHAADVADVRQVDAGSQCEVEQHQCRHHEEAGDVVLAHEGHEHQGDDESHRNGLPGEPPVHVELGGEAEPQHEQEEHRDHQDLADHLEDGRRLLGGTAREGGSGGRVGSGHGVLLVGSVGHDAQTEVWVVPNCPLGAARQAIAYI